ncbi:MAG: hypothetical protein IT548_06490 [Alphaproteobacteria bacterium]|nr:hypothetical protein [Alphaproteobacteria bacterium]
MRSTACVIAFSVSLALVGTAAAKPELLGEFGDWKAFKSADGGTTVCYALSTPKESLPKNVKRDPIFFIISNFPARQVKGEPSVVAGYPFKDGTKATVSVGGSDFAFATVNQNTDGGAWLPDSATEQKLIAAMRGGSKMTVKGTSRRGTNTTDSYSLSGISGALDRINQECP